MFARCLLTKLGSGQSGDRPLTVLKKTRKQCLPSCRVKLRQYDKCAQKMIESTSSRLLIGQEVVRNLLAFTTSRLLCGAASVRYSAWSWPFADADVAMVAGARP